MKLSLRHRNCEYSSHQPVLIDIIKRTTGPVLELGAGEGSTELLHHLCRDRLLYTIDNNGEWLNKYADRLLTSKHIFKLLDYPEILKDTYIINTEWEVVFIDQGDWDNRAECLHFFKDKTKYVILHDSYYYPMHGHFGKIIKPIVHNEEEGICDYSDAFKYYKEYYPILPWNSPWGIMTLVGSNFVPVPEEIDMSIESIEI